MSTRMISCWLILVSVFGSVGLNAEAQQSCIGRVVDDSAQPLSGVTVTLYTWTVSRTGQPGGLTTTSQTTDQDGSFVFSAPAAQQADDGRQQALVLARKDGFAMAWDGWNTKEDLASVLKLTKTASVGGKVVSDDGRPVTGAEVELVHFSVYRKIYVPQASLVPGFSTKTGTDGSFSFGDLAEETTTEFLVRAQGCATVCTYDPCSSTGGFSPGQAGIRIVMAPEAKIEGKVIDKATGKGAGGLTVKCSDATNKASIGMPSAVSGEDGAFVLGTLEARQYVLTVDQPSKGATQWVAQPANVTTQTGQTTSGVVIELSGGGMLEVRTLDSNKQPVAKAFVSVMLPDGPRAASAASNDQGIATIRLVPGSYSVSASKKGLTHTQEQTITVEDGKTAKVDLVLKTSPAISGIVRDPAGKPAADVTIGVFPMGNGGNVKSDAEGRYNIKWQPEQMGNSQMQFMLVARQVSRNLATISDIDEDTRSLDLTLAPGITFFGKVEGPNSVPLPNAKVQVMLATSNYSTQLDNHEVLTDSKGLYEYKAVPDNSKCYVEMSANGYGQLSTTVQSSDAVDGRLEIETMVLKPATLNLSGTVVDANNSPVANARISAYGDGQPYLNATSDARGRFSMGKLCDGQVQINAWVNLAGDQVYGDARAQAGDTDVVIVVSPQGSRGSVKPKPVISLIGKPLPDISSLALNADPGTLAGKPMLLCFVDQSQRPSRHCLSVLASKYQDISAKGLAVAVIQIGDSALAPKPQCSVGRIAMDDKTQSIWGIVHMPWLVLTDERHTVVAEGFSVSDVDEQIAKVSASK